MGNHRSGPKHSMVPPMASGPRMLPNAYIFMNLNKIPRNNNPNPLFRSLRKFISLLCDMGSAGIAYHREEKLLNANMKWRLSRVMLRRQDKQAKHTQWAPQMVNCYAKACKWHCLGPCPQDHGFRPSPGRRRVVAGSSPGRRRVVAGLSPGRRRVLDGPP